MAYVLKPCPWCGQALTVIAAAATCETAGCYGGRMPYLNLGSRRDVAAWNRRREPGRIDPRSLSRQREIIEAVRAKPLTAQQISLATGRSESTTRKHIRRMLEDRTLRVYGYTQPLRYTPGAAREN